MSPSSLKTYASIPLLSSKWQISLNCPTCSKNCTLKNGNMANLMLCIFYHNKPNRQQTSHHIVLHDFRLIINTHLLSPSLAVNKFVSASLWRVAKEKKTDSATGECGKRKYAFSCVEQVHMKFCWTEWTPLKLLFLRASCCWPSQIILFKRIPSWWQGIIVSQWKLSYCGSSMLRICKNIYTLRPLPKCARHRACFWTQP